MSFSFLVLVLVLVNVKLLCLTFNSKATLLAKILLILFNAGRPWPRGADR